MAMMMRSSNIRRSVIPFSSNTQHHLWTWTSSTDDPQVTNPSSPAPDKKKVKIGAQRLSSVVDVINEKKLPPELRGRANAIRSETDITNVVEQRIYRSMIEGEFENLPGKGKPLDLRTNPHVDPAEDTLYRILSKNGCAPEWVELNKEIRSLMAEWHSSLKKAWEMRTSDEKWKEDSEALKAQMHGINNKMFGLKWEKEVDRLEKGDAF
ncbi:hypothetical protein AMTRI_Chr10g1050 [Amborella trichopoda]